MQAGRRGVAGGGLCARGGESAWGEISGEAGVFGSIWPGKKSAIVSETVFGTRSDSAMLKA